MSLLCMWAGGCGAETLGSLAAALVLLCRSLRAAWGIMWYTVSTFMVCYSLMFFSTTITRPDTPRDQFTEVRGCVWFMHLSDDWMSETVNTQTYYAM